MIVRSWGERSVSTELSGSSPLARPLPSLVFETSGQPHFPLQKSIASHCTNEKEKMEPKPPSLVPAADSGSLVQYR